MGFMDTGAAAAGYLRIDYQAVKTLGHVHYWRITMAAVTAVGGKGIQIIVAGVGMATDTGHIDIMAITEDGRIMVGYRMANLAYSVKWLNGLDIITATGVGNKGGGNSYSRNTILIVVPARYRVMNHLDVGVTMGIMAVPAKLPAVTCHVFATKMG